MEENKEAQKDDKYAEEQIQLLQQIRSDILADGDNIHYFLIPLVLTDAHKREMHIISHYELRAYMTKLKQSKKELAQYKKQLQEVLDFKYIYKCGLLYTNTANLRASEMIRAYAKLLYEISQIKDPIIRNLKLQFLATFISERLENFGEVLAKVVNSFRAMTEAKSVIYFTSDKDFTDLLSKVNYMTFSFDKNIKSKDDVVNFIKQNEKNEQLFNYITRSINDFATYLLGTGTEKQTLDDYDNRYKDNTTTSYLDDNNVLVTGILFRNIYTDYDSKTDDGVANSIRRSDAIDQKYEELWQKIKTRTTYITIQEIAKTLSFSDDDKDVLNKQQKEDTTGLEVLTPKTSNTNYIFTDKTSNVLYKVNNNVITPISKITGEELADEEELKILIANADLKYEKPIDPFDILVLEAIKDIYDSGNMFFDVAMVKAQILKRSTGRERDNSQFETDIKNSIEKMRKTDLTLEVTKQIAKTFNVRLTDDNIKKLGERNYILPLAVTEVNKGRNKKE